MKWMFMSKKAFPLKGMLFIYQNKTKDTEILVYHNKTTLQFTSEKVLLIQVSN